MAKNQTTQAKRWINSSALGPGLFFASGCLGQIEEASRTGAGEGRVTSGWGGLGSAVGSSTKGQGRYRRILPRVLGGFFDCGRVGHSRLVAFGSPRGRFPDLEALVSITKSVQVRRSPTRWAESQVHCLKIATGSERNRSVLHGLRVGRSSPPQ